MAQSLPSTLLSCVAQVVRHELGIEYCGLAGCVSFGTAPCATSRHADLSHVVTTQRYQSKRLFESVSFVQSSHRGPELAPQELHRHQHGRNAGRGRDPSTKGTMASKW